MAGRRDPERLLVELEWHGVPIPRSFSCVAAARGFDQHLAHGARRDPLEVEIDSAAKSGDRASLSHASCTRVVGLRVAGPRPGDDRGQPPQLLVRRRVVGVQPGAAGVTVSGPIAPVPEKTLTGFGSLSRKGSIAPGSRPLAACRVRSRPTQTPFRERGHHAQAPLGPRPRPVVAAAFPRHRVGARGADQRREPFRVDFRSGTN